MSTLPAEPGDRRLFLAIAPFGLIPILCGLLWTAWVYPWASMVDPSLVGWERNRLILQKMFPGAVPGAVLIIGGTVFISMCITYAISGSARFRPTAARMAFLFAVLLIPVIVAVALG